MKTNLILLSKHLVWMKLKKIPPVILSPSKGQLIAKGLFAIIDFFQKITKTIRS